MPHLLGIDVGTTNTKVVLCDPEGRIQGQASAPTPTSPVAPGQATSDPEEVYATVLRAMGQAASQCPSAEVVGIAVSSMAEAGVPLDSHNVPIYPIIAWHDNRTLPYRAWWAERLDEDAQYAITGLQPGHIYSLNKLLWLRDHEPATYRRLARWLSVSDYVAYRLCGVQAMSYSQASRTLAFDVRSLQWSDSLLQLSGVAPGVFPTGVSSGQALGPLCSAAARACGLTPRALVAAGGHDHLCAALACGVVAPGTLLDSIGTTEAMLTPLGEPRTTPEVRRLGLHCGVHVVPRTYYAIGGLLGIGPLQSWLVQNLLGLGPGDEAYTRLAALVADSPPGARGLLFLPFLAGGGAPQIDPRAAGGWLGLRLQHTCADMARAALEGVAFELRRLLDSIAVVSDAAGVAALRAVGGGSRSDLGLQLRADVTGRLVQAPASPERAALGAALLGGLGAGVYAHPQEAARVYAAARTFYPDPQRQQLYAERYGQYLQALPARTLGLT
ncbi:MAG: FGGY-family carbohydrate kinase [Anaerolineae bacterium]